MIDYTSVTIGDTFLLKGNMSLKVEKIGKQRFKGLLYNKKNMLVSSEVYLSFNTLLNPHYNKEITLKKQK